MDAVKQNYLLLLSLSFLIQEKPDYVEIFERVSKLDKDSFCLISTDELLAYNQVLFHCFVMDEYAKKGNFWWKDSSPNFTSLVYHQLLEKRISITGNQRSYYPTVFNKGDESMYLFTFSNLFIRYFFLIKKFFVK